jgi:hypothetical protein
MRHITLSPVTSLVLQYIYTFSQKRHYFWQRNENWRCPMVLSKTLPATFHIIARNQRGVVINMQRSSWKVRLLCGILMKLEYSSQIFEKISDTKRNENLFNWSRFVPWGETDGQTDMVKLSVVCSNYANAKELTCTPPSYTIWVQKDDSFRICSWNFMRNELSNLLNNVGFKVAVR